MDAVGRFEGVKPILVGRDSGSASALYFASGAASGLASWKGVKLCEARSPFQTTLFSAEFSYSMTPRFGLVPLIPSVLSA